ncbi:glycoside hydrolase family 97 protein [Pseudoduganella lutea]|uniref:Glycoside hydrolase family 97 protein n=1 Tax=Pseudoduganella lutea TaxID=321985 RepID=A0A4P6KS47_9BURK|nr:glycoside hydrolase family 97 protein [Pseudoduganella lutea]QBE61929.1 glycoside hydrolase family 97 protein [Pseudoduganella lutea]
MKRTISPLAALALASTLTSTPVHAAPALTSPDGRLSASFGDAPLAEGKPDGIASFTLSYGGKPILMPSPLSLRTWTPQAGSKGYRLVGASPAREVKDSWAPVAGRFARVPDHYRETILTYQDAALPQRRIDVVFRLYDQGAAFRYVIHGTPGERLAIKKEDTQYAFAADFDCWGYNQGQYTGGHEGEFDPVKASKIRDASLYTLPLVCKTGQAGTTIALTVSDVRDYPVAFVGGRENGAPGVQLKHPVRFDTPSSRRQTTSIAEATLGKEGFRTPWNVLMVADSPAALATTSLVQTLAAPSRIADTSWIKPGKVAWDWWNGSQAAVAEPGMNTATYKAFVDFAAELGLEYIMIDEGWSVGSAIEPVKGADVTRHKPELDLPAVIAYARTKGVGVWLWLQWEQLDQQMDKALATYERWGIKGIKVDFMNRADQQMVNYYERLIGKAAQHRIMVNMHGGYPSMGLERTWPNLLTQEGIMGAEFNKWSSRVTATHNVTLPFTRMLLGPGDYTPGAMRHVAPGAMQQNIRFNNPYVQTTRGHNVAMYVVYDTPLQMVSDSPPSYRKADGSWQDGVDFIKAVPVTWDETRVLQGDIGQYVVTARRSGNDWYIGAMSNEQARTIDLPLDFLGQGRYQARVWEDGAAPDTLKVSDRTVDAGARLRLDLAASGGAAVVLRRAP